MSKTTLYIICPDGVARPYSDYANGYGSAPQVWERMSVKYLKNIHRRGEWGGGKRNWLTDDSVLRELYDLACRGGMKEFERRTLWVCADWVICRPADFECYANALETYANRYASEHKGEAFHIGAMAEDLRQAAIEHPDARGACWQMTSVDSMWDYGEMTDERRASMLKTALAGVVPSDRIGDAISALEGWGPVDVRVPYNIDIDDRHQWLPGCDQQDWP